MIRNGLLPGPFRFLPVVRSIVAQGDETTGEDTQTTQDTHNTDVPLIPSSDVSKSIDIIGEVGDAGATEDSRDGSSTSLRDAPEVDTGAIHTPSQNSAEVMWPELADTDHTNNNLNESIFVVEDESGVYTEGRNSELERTSQPRRSAPARIPTDKRNYVYHTDSTGIDDVETDLLTKKHTTLNSIALPHPHTHTPTHTHARTSPRAVPRGSVDRLDFEHRDDDLNNRGGLLGGARPSGSDTTRPDALGGPPALSGYSNCRDLNMGRVSLEDFQSLPIEASVMSPSTSGSENDGDDLDLSDDDLGDVGLWLGRSSLANTMLSEDDGEGEIPVYSLGQGMIEYGLSEDEKEEDQHTEGYKNRRIRFPRILSYFEGVKNGDLEAVIDYMERDGKMVRDINLPDAKGFSALHTAAQLGYTNIVVYLLDRGADVNITNFENCTPLHYAVIEEDYELAKLLVEHNASVDIVDYDGKTPLDLMVNPPADLLEIMQQRAQMSELNSTEGIDGSPAAMLAGGLVESDSEFSTSDSEGEDLPELSAGADSSAAGSAETYAVVAAKQTQHEGEVAEVPNCAVQGHSGGAPDTKAGVPGDEGDISGQTQDNPAEDLESSVAGCEGLTAATATDTHTVTSVANRSGGAHEPVNGESEGQDTGSTEPHELKDEDRQTQAQAGSVESESESERERGPVPLDADSAIGRRASAIGAQEQLVNQKAEIVSAQIKALEEHVLAVDGQMEAVGRRLRAMDAADEVGTQEIAEVDGQVQAVNQEVMDIDKHVTAVNEQVDSVDEHVRVMNTHVRALEAHVHALGGDEGVPGMGSHVQALDEQLKSVNESISCMDTQLSAVDEIIGSVGEKVKATNAHVLDVIEQNTPDSDSSNGVGLGEGVAGAGCDWVDTIASV